MQVKTRSHRVIITLCAVVLVIAGCAKKEQPVEVVLSLTGKARSIRKATVVVDYSQASARPVLRGDTVSCTSILPGVQGEFADDGNGHLTVDLSAPAGMSVPTDFAVCRMTPEAPGISSKTIGKRLRVRLAQALDAGGKPLEEKALAKATRGSHRPAGSGAAATRPEAAGSTAGVTPPAASGGRPKLEGSRSAAPSGGRRELLGSPPVASRAGSNAAVGGSAGAPQKQAPATGTSRRSLTMAPGAAGSAATPPAAAQAPAEQALPNEAARANANEDTDLDTAAKTYEILFGITSSSGPVAALDFSVSFLGGSGGWEGAGGGVNCSPEAPSSLAAFNDQGHGGLRAGMVWQAGIDTPVAVAACVFKSREVVEAGSFRVEVIDASDPDVTPIDPLPVVEVLNVR